MSEEKPNKHAQRQQAQKARLTERLRANLQRRKAQARSRREGEPDARPDGLLKDDDQDLKDGE